MFKKITFLALVGSLVGLTSCETDFSLNGEYELTPVVFGLLDQNDTIHMIKITKAFLGDGNNLEYAQNPDSSYFNQVEAKVIEIDNTGDTTRVWELKDSIVTGKSTDGIFYAPDQKIYFFTEPNLISDYTYVLTADLNEGEKSITSETTLIKNFSLPSSIKAASFRVRFANNTVVDEDDYLNWTISIAGIDNAASKEVGYSIHWTENYFDGTSASFSARKFELRSDDVDRSIIISGIDFYKWIAEVIPDDPAVESRDFDGLDLHLSYGHKVLKQYMDVSKPVTGVAQIQPIFTNITGGYGLFSSRFLFTYSNLQLSLPTAKELSTGTITYNKKFNE